MIEYKLLTKDNFPSYVNRILQLFKTQFTAEVKAEDFIWRYLKTPYKDTNAVVALDGEAVVGFVGTMPNVACLRGKHIKAAMYTNMVTHPSYSGQGISSKILSILETELKKKRYEFIYAFPNNQSNHIFIDKCGWKDIYEIPRMEISNIRKSEPVYPTLLQDNHFEMDYSKLPVTLGEKGFIHDIAYRNWRIKDNSAAVYDNFVVLEGTSVSAYITVRKYKDEYNIVDMCFDTEEKAKRLVYGVMGAFMKMGYRILTAWCPVNTALHSIFEKAGFMNKYPITYFAGKVIRGGYNLDLLDWNGWHLQAIDDNIY